jgi:hypothetical protein
MGTNVDVKKNVDHVDDDKKKDVHYGPEKESKIQFIASYTGFLAFVLSVIPIINYVYLTSLDPLLKLMIYVGCAGGIGGIVYSALGFARHYYSGDFKLGYKYWYYSRPIIGSFLGIFSFLFLAGGLMTLANVSKDDFTDVNLILVTKMFYIALAFLAGFSTNNFIAKLKDVSQSVFTKENTNDSIETTKTTTTATGDNATSNAGDKQAPASGENKT